MTSPPAPGVPAAARPAPRRSGLPPRPLVAVLLAAVALAVLVLPRAPAAAATGLPGLLVGLAAAAFLVLRAPRTAAPSGWRWLGVSVGVSLLGGFALSAATGTAGSGVLGTIPGQLLTVVGVARLVPAGCLRGARGHLFTTAPLFALATLLSLHEIVAMAPPLGAAPPLSFAVALAVVPVALALTTATALLFAADSGPGRQRVALLVLTAQLFAATGCTAGVVGRATGAAAAHGLVWPCLGGAVAALCLAARDDAPRPPHPAGPSPLRALGATGALLPHVTALLAGGLVLTRMALTSEYDLYGALVGLAGLGLLVAHQAVMWRTQQRLTAELVRSESYFRTLVRSSVDPVVILDERLRITFASPALSRLLGSDSAGTLGRSIAELMHPDDAPVLFGALTGSGRGDDAAVRTARMRHADGRWRLIQCTVRDLRGDPDVDALVLFCRDVSPRQPASGPESELLELALTDPVTGLPNRAALVRRLGAVQRGGPGARPAALALLGVTGLAGAEALGEGTEATVLRALTSRLTRALRGEDWLARGKDGDFVVLVDGTVADAEVVAARLVANVGPLVTSAGPVELAASAGVTGLPADVDPGQALRRCSVAQRSAAQAGTGTVHRYDDALRMQQTRRDALRADLAGAAARGELRLVFQPVVDLVLRSTTSVEALLRWSHPVFGEVPPAEFVPLAEETPLIGELGRWVLREACATVAALAGTDLAVAVNVSARQVRSGELVADVLGALQAGGLPASRLIVEITESVLMDDAHVIEDLAALRRLGVRIAVDDFGTGWSSLAYLVGLPVDVLKMDQHFLSGMAGDPQRQALCRAVLQLGGSLGLPVVVEGVTTTTELDLLRDMGHRYLQGYLFSRPLEAGQLAAGAWRTGIAVPATGSDAGGPA